MISHRRAHSWWMVVLLICSSVAVQKSSAQPTDLLELETISVGSSGPATFIFSDHGTGASDYTVQSAATVNDPITWEPESGASVQSIGNGQYQVTVAQGSPDRFYRVIGANGTVEPIQIGFSTTEFSTNEGGSVSPTITFSRAYYGTIRYSIDGNAGAGDYSGLSGEIQVNGTTAVIPITLNENSDIDEIKQLVLTLISGAGAETGGASSATITIGENDAVWRGTIFDAASTLGFAIRITQGAGSTTATLLSDGSGVVSEGEYSAAITLTDTVFSFLSSEVPLNTETTFQGLPAIVKLDLDAVDGQTGQSVEENKIQGTGKLIVQYAGNDHLNRTNSGLFLMIPEPDRPSTDPLELVDLP